jgi:hypothetical protein
VLIDLDTQVRRDQPTWGCEIDLRNPKRRRQKAGGGAVGRVGGRASQPCRCVTRGRPSRSGQPPHHRWRSRECRRGCPRRRHAPQPRTLVDARQSGGARGPPTARCACAAPRGTTARRARRLCEVRARQRQIRRASAPVRCAHAGTRPPVSTLVDARVQPHVGLRPDARNASARCVRVGARSGGRVRLFDARMREHALLLDAPRVRGPTWGCISTRCEAHLHGLRGHRHTVAVS